MIAHHCRRHRHQELLRFLKLIDAAVPKAWTSHLVLDNTATHMTPEVKDRLLRHPRSICTSPRPVRSSWLNLVERWLTELTTRKSRRSAHRSVTALEAGVRRWIDGWNADPDPFVWIKRADQILETLAAYCGQANTSRHLRNPY